MRTSFIPVIDCYMNFKTPILFLAFNRPELTAQVFRQIRVMQPATLYVAIDGPRSAGERKLTEKVRQVIQVDWPCDVRWKINDINMGCRQAVSSAVTWFFETEHEGIILEDDCLPNLAFFPFCQLMLERYRNDYSIGHVSGSSFVPVKTSDSYYCSKYSHSWGWATWARVWQKYEVNVPDYESLDYTSLFDNLFERIYWYEKFRGCARGDLKTWDYQVLYLLWQHQLKSITPQPISCPTSGLM